MPAQGLDLLVFRDGARRASGSAQKTALAREICSLQNSFQPVETLRALLRAGELECAFADCDVATGSLEEVTDSLATALVNSQPIPNLLNLLTLIDSAPVPEQLQISLPEGFAYYGLHPLAFANVLEQFPKLPSGIAVIGIRSIGTTLSAITAAGLRQRGSQASRITVRPVGHPYNRHLKFSTEQMDFVSKGISCGARFWIVDEGPGLSGSSFLSVAEALVEAGVSRQEITIICSHVPHPERMCADNAAQRWQRFRWIATPSEPRRPKDATTWIGGGEWRRFLLREKSCWPPCWPSFERQKYLSIETPGSRVYKFLGFGHYADEILEREQRVAAGGFGPCPEMESDGFCAYQLVRGRPMLDRDLSEHVLARLAAYCAFRWQTFAISSAELSPLRQMAEHNLHELRLDVPVELRLEQAVTADGRMHPHEWLFTREGGMVKTDSGSHGDDHFFPGPCDIAWDLAGAIVEWQMNASQAEIFLELYRRTSGDDPRARIADYINAYAVFRCAYCLMAANATHGSEEELRLERAAVLYRIRLIESAGRSRLRAAPAQRSVPVQRA